MSKLKSNPYVFYTVHMDHAKIGDKWVKRYYCPSPSCKNWEYSYKDLKKHVTNYHEHLEKFVCDSCKKDFKSLRRLVKHKCPKASPRLEKHIPKVFHQATLV